LLVSGNDPDIEVEPVFPAWSPDGKTLYYKAMDTKFRASFWSIPVSGGSPKLLVRFDDPSLNSVRVEFVTDGSSFYFTLTDSESDIWIMGLQVGEK